MLLHDARAEHAGVDTAIGLLGRGPNKAMFRTFVRSFPVRLSSGGDLLVVMCGGVVWRGGDGEVEGMERWGVGACRGPCVVDFE